MAAMPQQTPGRSALPAAAAWAALATVVVSFLWGGVTLRRWAWDATSAIRFTSDIRNAYAWGRRAQRIGLHGVYEDPEPPGRLSAWLANEPRPWGKMDYAPLRLWIITQWVRWTRQPWQPEHYRTADDWIPDYEFSRPLLRTNLICEITSAVATFFLARLWLRRRWGAPAATWRPSAATWMGLLPALLFWFDPAVIWNAHCWPQWDIWPIPFFLLAMLLGSMNRWLSAGVMIAVAALLKGQALLAAPVLPLSALFGGHWRGAGRFFVGFALGLGVLTAPFLVRSIQAGVWVGAAVLPVLVLPRRFRPVATAAVLAGALLVCPLLLGGSYAWLEQGWGLGTWQRPYMGIGQTRNLPAILRDRYGWNDVNALVWGQVTIRRLLQGMYAVWLILCAVGAAMHSRRNDPRVLVALSAPWLLFAALLPQMHERYLVYAAAMTAVAAAAGIGPALLHLLISGAALMNMAASMLKRTPEYEPWLRFLRNSEPDMGWMVLVVAAIFLYLSVAPRQRPTPRRCSMG